MLYNIDAQIFHWINSDLSNALFDFIMPWLREKKTWIPLYIVLAVFLIYKYRRTGLFMILFTILTVSTSDMVSNYGFKKTFKRLRPCKTEMTMPVIKRVPCGSGYSFTSNHAANHFAIATFLGLLFGYKRKLVFYGFYTWAFSIAFAQVYVGLHYPSDIIGGGLLGAAIGFLWFIAYKRFMGINKQGTQPQV